MADISNVFVSSIAQTLNTAGIPCVLWGHYLLQAHGVPTVVDSIDFIVPDNHLNIAAKALENLLLLSACPDLATCFASSSSPARQTPPAAAHLHINGTQVTVGLYPQSDTLWFLPPLNVSLFSNAPDKDHSMLPPYFCLASDSTVMPPRRPGRGSGVFRSGYHPVIVPRNHLLLEAILRLYARDSGKMIGSLGMAMISYMEEYVDDDGLLDTKQLPEPLGTFYQDLRAGRKPVRQWTRELQEALGVPIEDSDDD